MRAPAFAGSRSFSADSLRSSTSFQRESGTAVDPDLTAGDRDPGSRCPMLPLAKDLKSRPGVTPIESPSVIAMSARITTGGTDVKRLELSPAEQWVLHHLMLDRVDRAREQYDSPPWWAVDVVEKLERGELSFSTFEAWRLRQDLRRYIEEAPDRDADEAESILATLETAFESPPASVQG